jgi:hypothetical protein
MPHRTLSRPVRATLVAVNGGRHHRHRRRGRDRCRHDRPQPGGVGVTITKTTRPVWVENGRLLQPQDRIDADHSYSGATKWDPFTSHEVVIKLHCTNDTNQAVVKDLGPSPL